MDKPNILYSESQVAARIKEMAEQIAEAYDPHNTLFVSLLNGGAPFTFQLVRAIQDKQPDFHPNVQYMMVSRYGAHREPGELQIITDLPPAYRDLSGRNVILLDDLLDQGGTLAFTKQHLLDYGAEMVDCVVLVKKRRQPAVDFELAMFGFEAPDEWIIGMGMDDSSQRPEVHRWTPWIGTAD